MQAKGFIRLFIIALILVALYQLSFTLFTSKQNKNAKAYATEMLPSDMDAESPEGMMELKDLENDYLDSIKNEVVLNLGIADYTYSELQEKQLGLGLDLKGGISMLVEIDQADLLRKIALDTKDEGFNKAVEATVAGQADNQKAFLDAFLDNYEDLNPDASLAGVFAPIEEFREKVTWDSSNEEVLKAVKEQVDAKVGETHNVLKTRIDEFGVAQPFISDPDDNGRIYIELPGAENTDRIVKIIQSSALLEFYETYDMTEIGNYLGEANEVLIELLGLSDSTVPVETVVEDVEADGGLVEDVVDAVEEGVDALDNELDDLGELDELDDLGELDTEEEEERQVNPLFDILYPNISTDEATGQQRYNQSAVIGYVSKRNIDEVKEFLAYEEVQNIFPRDMLLAWSAKPIVDNDGNTTDTYMLYALKKGPDGKAALTGEGVIDAYSSFDELGRAQVGMSMNALASNKWAKLTRENEGRQIAIVLDDKVFSAPVSRGEIAGGRSSIDGMADIDEANDLSNILRSGKLDAQINIPQSATVGASLGKESIRKGLTALLIGLLTVVLFMVLYYSGAGVIADIALLVNLILILGYLASKGAALTLPGLAGIVLTIGMAVDANVIIFERIREELRKGKGLRLAIQEGFSKSYAAIIDANVTTFIAGAVLLWLGRGPVQGFAIVLLVGIVASVITAVLLSRLIFDSFLTRERTVGFSMPWSKNILTNTSIDFVGKRKMAYIFSAIVIVAGLVSIATKKFDLGVDFKGGRSYVVAFDQDVSTDEVRTTLSDVFEGEVPKVKTYGEDNTIQIITSYEIENNDPKMDSIIKSKLFSGLTGFFNEAPTTEAFMNTEDYVEQSNKVDTSIADDIKWTALQAGIVGAILIFFYLLIRFRKWQFGAGALGAVIHDALIMLGIFSIFWGILPFSLEIEQKFIAAILTIIGYSINDTVVVFDRIREFFNEHPSRDVKTNVNAAINSTLSRTLMTSLTTFIVVAILFFFGGEAIKGFSFALLIGVLVGTYSSIFIASSILVDTLKDDKKKLAKGKAKK